VNKFYLYLSENLRKLLESRLNPCRFRSYLFSNRR